MTPDDFWPSLETDSLSLAPGDLVARRVCVESACDIRLAVQAPNSHRMLLVMLEPKHLPLNVELPAAADSRLSELACLPNQPAESASR